jgi:hypothetical protein
MEMFSDEIAQNLKKRPPSKEELRRIAIKTNIDPEEVSFSVFWWLCMSDILGAK